jgi:hypothetical protein
VPRRRPAVCTASAPRFAPCWLRVPCVAVASGFRDSRRGLTALAAFGLRVGWQQPLAGRWSAAVQADALTPIVRTTLWIDDVPIWTMPRVAVRAALLGIWTFH